jgi:hypothetical protein
MAARTFYTLYQRRASTIPTHTIVIPGMNAIAFTREVRALSCAPRRMVFSVMHAAILRGSPRGSHLRMTATPLRRMTSAYEIVGPILPDGQISQVCAQGVCPVPFAKIFLFPSKANHLLNLRHPVPREGRWPSSLTWDGERWTRELRLTSAAQAVRRNRVVLTPQWLVSSSQGAQASWE